MKSAKTVGGTTSFQTRKNAVLKWVLNRPFQSKFYESLKEISDVEKTTTNVKKCLRPSEILKSNEIVLKIQGVMKEQFLYPFNESLDIGKLYNLVSGRPVSNVIADSLLHIDSSGSTSLHSFEQRLHTDTPIPFFDPIKRKKQPTFKSDEIKIKLRKKGDSKTAIEIERNILGMLLAESNKNNFVIDINKALCYPLSPVSAPLSTEDGCRRKTAKSALFEAAVSDIGEANICHANSICDTYIIDLAAFIRTVISQCSTIRDIAKKILLGIPDTYGTIYVVCDSYLKNSIKSAERLHADKVKGMC